MSALDDPKDSEMPSGGHEESSQFVTLKRMVTRGEARRAKWRKEAKRAFDFVANHQWSEEDKKLLDSQNRPAVSFNRSSVFIKAICGLEVNNRQTVAYLPREVGDSGIDEALTATAKWMRDGCMADDEESLAFRDLSICGEGWVESRMDYDIDPKGAYMEERMNPMEMGVTEGACHANYTDTRGIYRIREMTPEDAEDLFDGKYDADTIHADWLNPAQVPTDGGQGNKTDYPDKTRDGVKKAGTGGKVRVVQLQFWQRETVHMVAQPGDSDVTEMSDAEHVVYAQRHRALQAAAPSEAPVPDYQHAQVKKKKFYQAFLGKIQLSLDPMPMNEFQFKPMTGEYDETDKCFYGVMRDLFDPQMWANKWLSQTMHIMNTTAKGGILAETDAFANVRKAEKDWADNTKIVWVAPGAIAKNKVKERVPPPMPQGLDMLMQFALSSMRDVTGINLEILGQADREQAASLEAQRRQSAMTILATLFGNLRRFRIAQGRLMLHFIQLLPPGTLARVLQDGKQQYIPVMQTKPVECYDVIIDETPTSPDQKMMIWNTTTQLLQSGLPLPPPAIVALLKYSPYPESVVQEITDAMGLGQTQPPQILQQKLQQAEQALQVLEQKYSEALTTAKNEQDTQALQIMKLEIDEYKARTDRMNAELVFAAAEKRNEASLNQTIIQALAPQPGAADGEGDDGAGGGQQPDLAQMFMTHMQNTSQTLAAIQQQLQQQSSPPNPGAPAPGQQVPPAPAQTQTP